MIEIEEDADMCPKLSPSQLFSAPGDNPSLSHHLENGEKNIFPNLYRNHLLLANFQALLSANSMFSSNLNPGINSPFSSFLNSTSLLSAPPSSPFLNLGAFNPLLQGGLNSLLLGALGAGVFGSRPQEEEEIKKEKMESEGVGWDPRLEDKSPEKKNLEMSIEHNPPEERKFGKRAESINLEAELSESKTGPTQPGAVSMETGKVSSESETLSLETTTVSLETGVRSINQEVVSELTKNLGNAETG